MFFPPPGVKYEHADLRPIAVDDGDITFTKTFILPGSVLAYDLKDNDSSECRINSDQECSRCILSHSKAVQKELRIYTRRLLMKG